MPTLSLPEGVHVELPDGEPVGAALPKGTIAARVDGKLRDLSYTPDDDADVEPISPHPTTAARAASPTAHVLAQAVCDLYPGRSTPSGPPSPTASTTISSFPNRCTPATSRRSTVGCGRSRSDQRFVREEVSRDEAIERLRDQPFKVEIIEGIEMTPRRRARPAPGRSCRSTRTTDGPTCAWAPTCRTRACSGRSSSRTWPAPTGAATRGIRS